MTAAATILLVEDEPAVKSLLAQALRRGGYTVHEARNGVEALALEATLPHIDVLVTDVVMPEMKGPELARRLREKQEDLKVIFLSGYVAPGGLADDQVLLQKPFVSGLLLDTIKDVLGER